MNNYDRIKKLIYYALKDAKQEALDDGIDITSPEFESILSRLKDKLLQKLGISPAKYRQIEELEKQKKLSKRWEERTEISGEINKKISEVLEQVGLKKDYLTKIDVLAKEQDKKIQNLTKKTDAEKKELLRKIEILKEQKDISDKWKDKQIKELKEWFLREIIRTDRKVDEMESLVKSDTKTIDSIVSSHKGLSKDVDVLKKKPIISPKLKEDIEKVVRTDWQGELQKGIKDLTPRLWHGMAMGLQNRIGGKMDSFSISEIDLSSQCDGSVTAFSLGRVVKYIIIINLSGTIVPHTLNVAKNQITLTFAPDSGEELKAITLI